MACYACGCSMYLDALRDYGYAEQPNTGKIGR
jgi:hypothetical protein